MTAFPNRWVANNYAGTPAAASVAIPSAPGVIVVVDGIVATMLNFTGVAKPNAGFDIQAMVNGVAIYLGSMYLDGTSAAGTSNEEFSGLALVGCTSVFASTGTAVDELLQVTGYIL